MSKDSLNRVDDASHAASADLPRLDVERCGAVTAHLRFFRSASPGEVLERLNVEVEAYEQSRAHWIGAIVEELATGEGTVGEQYEGAFARMKMKLDTERPTLESLGPRRAPREAAKPAEEQPVHSELTPPAEPEPPIDTPPPPKPQEAAPQRQLLTPSYLRAPVATQPQEPSPEDVDRTVLGGTPTRAPLLPFAGVRPAPPAAIPISRSPDAGGTVMAPLPEAVRAAIAPAPSLPAAAASRPSAPEFDPDETAAVMLSGEPTMPFAKPNPSNPYVPPPAPPSPSSERGTAAQRASSADDNPDETVMVKSPLLVRPPARGSLGEQLTPAAFPDLSVAAYAALHAELRVGGDRDETWQKAGVTTPASRKALQEHFFARFHEDPTLREEFEARLRRAIAELNRRR